MLKENRYNLSWISQIDFYIFCTISNGTCYAILNIYSYVTKPRKISNILHSNAQARLESSKSKASKNIVLNVWELYNDIKCFN